MTDILTEEEINHIKNRCIEEPWRMDLPTEKLIATIETLQAQNKRLVEALELIESHNLETLAYMNRGIMNLYPTRFIEDFIKRALSTLPAEALEAERRREEVIRAAKCIRHWHDAMPHPETGEPEGMIVSASHVRELWAALEALEMPLPEPPKDVPLP